MSLNKKLFLMAIGCAMFLSACFSTKSRCNGVQICDSHLFEMWREDFNGCSGARSEGVNCLMGNSGRDNYNLKGLSKDCIIQYLGEPNKVISDGDIFVYHVLRSEDCKTLKVDFEVEFDRGNKVLGSYLIIFD